MLLDMYELGLHVRGAALGILLATFLTWFYTLGMPLRFAAGIMIQALIFTTILLMVILWAMSKNLYGRFMVFDCIVVLHYI